MINKINEFKYEDVCVITAIGNSNQGKSFILSKIINMNITSGHNINTYGLSIFSRDNYYSNKNYIILDTIGLQNEIKIKNEEREEIKKLKEKEKIEKKKRNYKR